MFDPNEHTVNEVLEHLETFRESDPAEVDRVLAAEAAGKGRKGILGTADAEPLPAGQTAITAAPDGTWEALVDDRGELVTPPGGGWVQVHTG